MEQQLQQMIEILEDIFQCGLNSISGDLLLRIKKQSAECEQWGLHKGGELLLAIYQKLEQRRHQSEFNMDEVLMLLADLNLYIEYCNEKLEYELVLNNMITNTEDKMGENQHEY